MAQQKPVIAQEELSFDEADGTAIHLKGTFDIKKWTDPINEFDELGPYGAAQSLIKGKITTVKPDGTSTSLEGPFIRGLLHGKGVSTIKKARGVQVCAGKFVLGEFIEGTITEKLVKGNVCTTHTHTGTFKGNLLNGKDCESHTQLFVDGELAWSSCAKGRFAAGVLDLNDGKTYKCEGLGDNPSWKAFVGETMETLNNQAKYYGSVTEKLLELKSLCPIDFTVRGAIESPQLSQKTPKHIALVEFHYNPTAPFAAGPIVNVSGVATATYDLIGGAVTLVGAPGSAVTTPAPARDQAVRRCGNPFLRLFNKKMGDGIRVFVPLGADAAVLKAVCVSTSAAVDALDVAAAHVVYHKDGTEVKYGF